MKLSYFGVALTMATLAVPASAQKQTYKGGTDSVSSLQNNGVGIGKISAAGQKYAAKIPQIEQQIKDGTITPPDTVGKGT